MNIRYEPFKGRVLFHTTYLEYFKQNVHMFDALDFLAELTPDAWASNTTTKEWYDQPSISRRGDCSSSGAMACMPPGRKDGGMRCLGAGIVPRLRLRYDPDVIAVIEDSDELKRIFRHLVKIGRSPPGFDPDRLS